MTSAKWHATGWSPPERDTSRGSSARRSPAPSSSAFGTGSPKEDSPGSARRPRARCADASLAGAATRSAPPRAAPVCTDASALVDLVPRPELDDLAEVHDGHPVGDVTDDRKVVGDEEVREPELVLERARRLTTCAWIETSSAETGSSSTIILGFNASARATPIRCRCPPENSCGKRFACSGLKPTLRKRSSTRCSRPRHSYRRGSAAAPRRSPAPSSAGSAMRTDPGRRSGCHVAPGASAGAGNSVMSLPSKTIRPAVGSRSFMIVRPSVVFPQPDSPTTPSVSPSRDASDRRRPRPAPDRPCA